MTKTNKENQNSDKSIKIKRGESSLKEFIRRPLPTEEEIEEFEEIIGEEAREGEIAEGLSEIYQDDKAGDGLDANRLDIKKKRGLLFWFLSIIIFSGFLAAAGYGVYYYVFSGGSDATAIDFSIQAPEEVVAGEEFFYDLNYKNVSGVGVNNLNVELTYPDNFVFLDSSPTVQEKNSFWRIDNLPARGQGVIRIKGKLINIKDSDNIVLAKITYTPENFSSEFGKEASASTLVSDIGLETQIDYSSSALIGEENEIIIHLKGKEKNFFQQFNLAVEPADNLEIVGVAGVADNNEADKKLAVEKIKPTVWRISNLLTEAQELKLTYKINEKTSEEEEINLRFEQNVDSEKNLVFFEKNIKQEVVKSDLNLTLIINGSRNDQPVNFNDPLNYSLVYSNKGETAMKDVVMMAVLESDFLDWTTLKDPSQGREKGNTLTWSKANREELADLEPGEEGTIDFSIIVINFRETDLGKDFTVKSYAQFSVGEEEDSSASAEEEVDNRSNTIINKINSDLSLKEEVRYFNADNIPVGDGPLPPVRGETTSFKVYWKLTNNLHELQDTKAEVILPDYVSFAGKERAAVGAVSYDSANHKVVWQIGRLPTTVYQADAEFNISITPREEDFNKIMVLLSGAVVSAVDSETGGTINKKYSAKTTKLEDDEIASLSSDGRVK